MFFSFFKKAVNLELNLVYYSYLGLYFLHYLCKGCKEERGLCCPLHAACTAPVLVERDDSGRSRYCWCAGGCLIYHLSLFSKLVLRKLVLTPFPGQRHLSTNGAVWYLSILCSFSAQKPQMSVCFMSSSSWGCCWPSPHLSLLWMSELFSC